MSTSDATFRIQEAREPGLTLLHLSGVVDEHADLDALINARGSEVRVNLKGVRRINSFGVKAWVDAIRKIPKETRIVFVHCPPPVIDQCNMVAGFLGHGIIESFYAPMLCELCDEQLDHLFQTEVCRALGGKLPDIACPRCARVMEVDDLEEQYLFFVRHG